MIDAVVIWSGGKDSALALYRTLKNQTYRIKYLVTTFSAATERVSMHGVRKPLIEAQAKSIGISLWPVYITHNTTYESQMQATYGLLKKEGITTAIFGDIFLEDLKVYRQQQLASAGWNAYFPLWGEASINLVREFINLDFKAIFICINNNRLDLSFLGRLLDDSLLRDLPNEADPAGENGEYHSFVFAGPIFSGPVSFQQGEISFLQVATNTATPNSNYDTKFWYLDLLPPTI